MISTDTVHRHCVVIVEVLFCVNVLKFMYFVF